MKQKGKIIIGVILFIILLLTFGYFFVNQSYLLNKYKFNKLQEHTFIEDTLTIVSSSDVQDLKPDAVDFETKMRVYGNLYEGLVRFDKNNNVKPSLAISWGNLDDLTWEYKLRKGVRFHDGSKFSADSVVEVFEQLSGREDSQIPSYLKHIESIEKIDTHKIVIRTEKPDPLLNQKINSLLIAKDDYIGTGPYSFLAFDKKNGLNLKAYEDYWGDLPLYRNVVFKAISSKNSRVVEFGKGEIDILTAVPVDNSVVFDDKIKTVPSLEVSFLLFNQQTELWSDPRVRQISTKVVDKETLSSISGKYSKAVNQFVSPGVFGYSLNIKEKDYLPKKAREEALAIFGQEGKKVILDLTSDYGKIGEYIQKEFKALSIRVELNFISPQDLVQKISNKESEMHILGWQSASGDAGDLLNSLFLENAQLNSVFKPGSEESQRVTNLILETNQELNQKKRLNKLQNIMDILVDEKVVGLPLFEGERIYAVNSRINFEPRTDGMIVLNEIR